MPMVRPRNPPVTSVESEAAVELAERVRRPVLVLEPERDGVGPMGVRTGGDGQDDGARRAGRVGEDDVEGPTRARATMRSPRRATS